MAMSVLHIKVLLFAAARDAAGSDVVELQLTQGSSVADLKTRLLEQVPGLQRFSSSLLWAVNNEYASADRIILDQDQIACFPPVSGG